MDTALGEAVTGVRLRPDMLMLWLSAGKPLTAIGIAQMVEAGRIDLDAPIARQIPEFGQNGKAGITLRHILTHTGGFRGADLIPQNLDWRETIARICGTPLERDWVPGEKGGYHLYGSWFILGELLQRLSGLSYSDYVRQKILLPLGMKQSWVGMPAATFETCEGRIGLLHKTEGGGMVAHPVWRRASSWIEPRPGSNACGPFRELGRFYESLLGFGEGTILKRETSALFTRRHREGFHDQTFGHQLDFGLGFIVDSNRYGRETVPYGYGRHCSEATFGHGGAQSSCAFADPEAGLVVAWGCNGMPGEAAHQERVRAINSAIYEDLGLDAQKGIR